MNAQSSISTSAEGVHVERVDNLSGLAALEESWTRLALSKSKPSCFESFGYFRAWTETLADDVDWVVLVARQQGDVCGVLPLMLAHVRRGLRCAPRHDFTPSDRYLLNDKRVRPIPVRQLSAVVSMPAVLVGPAPLCADGTSGDVVPAFARAVMSIDGWDSLALPVVEEPLQVDWITALKGRGCSVWLQDLGRHISGIDGLSGFEATVARQNRNFRKNVRRAQAAATKADLKIEIHEGVDAVQAQMAQMGQVARRSWKAQPVEGLRIPFDGGQEHFFTTLIDQCARDRTMTPVLAQAVIDGAPVASLLSLRFGSTLTALLTFRAPVADKASPGLLLIGAMMDWAVSRGITAYDLNLTQNWARHLTNTTSTQNMIVAYAPSARGKVLSMISGAVRAIRG